LDRVILEEKGMVR